MFKTGMKWIEGISQSAKLKAVEGDWLGNTDPEDRFYGFENFGNTCYCNSVVQALYYCKPFRECALLYSFPYSTIKNVLSEEGLKVKDVLNYNLERRESATITASKKGLDAPLVNTFSSENSGTAVTADDLWKGSDIEQFALKHNLIGKENGTLLAALQNLFMTISCKTKRIGIHGPKEFVTKLKEENEIFAGTMQQDAHEMFNYLINDLAETLTRQKNEMRKIIGKIQNSASNPRDTKTWIHELFEGQLTNETKCLNCECITNRDESFFDLSVDIEPHSSLSTCLRHFSKSELLSNKNKFFCDTCNSLQEAEKSMKIKKLPAVLAVHLKRFKFQEQLGRFSKLSDRVCFTELLGLFNTTSNAKARDSIYELCAIIVHIGSGPNQGHYVAAVKSKKQWLLLDDEDVSEPLDELELAQYFGESQTSTGTGYLFIYSLEGFNADSLLSKITPDGWRPIHIPEEENISIPIVASEEFKDEVSPLDITPKIVSSTNGHRQQKNVQTVTSLHPPSITDPKRSSLPSILDQVEPNMNSTVVGTIDDGVSPSWNWFNKKEKKSK